MKKEKGMEMKKNKKFIADYLKLPYTRIVIPDSETGTYTAEILEFPGCISEGKTIKEAYERLERVAESWVEAALNLNQTIPPPAIIQGVGGKVVLRLPKSLHRQLVILAEREGTSLNQFILSAVSEKVGATKISYEFLKNIPNLIPFFQNPQVQTDYLKDMGKINIKQTSGTLGNSDKSAFSSHSVRTNTSH